MISSAVQKGGSVYVYGPSGNILFIKNGTLMGFTSTSLTVKVGTIVYVYNDKGAVMFTR